MLFANTTFGRLVKGHTRTSLVHCTTCTTRRPSEVKHSLPVFNQHPFFLKLHMPLCRSVESSPRWYQSWAFLEAVHQSHHPECNACIVFFSLSIATRVAAAASAMSFHLGYLRDRQEDIELLVSRAGVRLAFPLWPDPTAAAATASTAAQAGAEAIGGEGGGVDVDGEGPMFVYGRVGVRLRMEWTQVDGNRPPGRGGGAPWFRCRCRL